MSRWGGGAWLGEASYESFICEVLRSELRDLIFFFFKGGGADDCLVTDAVVRERHAVLYALTCAMCIFS